MRILFGAAVFSADSEPIGEVKEVVIDPATKAVTHLVIQQGLLFDNDRVVAAENVAEATEERVVLNKTAAQLGDLSSDYRERDFVVADPEIDAADDGVPSGRFWTRPVGVPASLIPPGLGRVELAPEVSIPLDDVMLVHGCPVQTNDGALIGRVVEVITAPDSKITHLLIHEGTVYPEPKLVPLDWIARFKDNEVYLCVGKTAVDQLPDFEGNA